MNKNTDQIVTGAIMVLIIVAVVLIELLPMPRLSALMGWLVSLGERIPQR